MPAKRFPDVERVPGILDRSGGDEKLSLSLGRMISRLPTLGEAIRVAGRMDFSPTCPRGPADWMLRALLHVASGEISTQKGWRDAEEEIRKLCGFEEGERSGRSQSTMYQRMTELEDAVDEVYDICATIAAAIRIKLPAFGRYWLIDSTASAAHVELRKRHPDRREKPGLSPHALSAADTKRRDEWEQLEAFDVSTGDSLMDESLAAALKDLTPVETPEGVVYVDENGEVRVKVYAVDAARIEERRDEYGHISLRLHDHDGNEGDWYDVRCPDASYRAYRDKSGRVKRVWVGYYHQVVVEAATGVVLYTNCISAGTQEYNAYEDTMRGAKSVAGEWPRAIAADAGFDTYAIFESNTRRGIASVIALRNHKNNRVDRDQVTHDRHGIPRCKHCGGPTKFHRFDHKSRGGPRLWFTCMHRSTKLCKRRRKDGTRDPERGSIQSIACSNDWRRLVPLWKTDPVYHQLVNARGNSESSHQSRRATYKVAGNDLASRHKRIGLGAQALRAALATLCDLLLIAYRLGCYDEDLHQWSLDRKRNRLESTTFRSAASDYKLGRVMKERKTAGLGRAYGPVAFKVGLADDALTPSERAAPPRAGPDDSGSD